MASLNQSFSKDRKDRGIGGARRVRKRCHVIRASPNNSEKRRQNDERLKVTRKNDKNPVVRQVLGPKYREVGGKG